MATDLLALIQEQPLLCMKMPLLTMEMFMTPIQVSSQILNMMLKFILLILLDELSTISKNSSL